MRFLMFDQITDFQKNRLICGVKQISQESGITEQLHREWIYPPSLAFESLAQIGGWLVSASLDFSVFAVLGMMTRAEAIAPIHSGDGLILRVEVLSINSAEHNAVVRGEIRRLEQCVIRIDKIVYGIFQVDDPQLVREQARLFDSLLNQ